MLIRPLVYYMSRRLSLLQSTAAAALALSTCVASTTSARNGHIIAFIAANPQRPSRVLRAWPRMFSTTESELDAPMVLPYEEGSHNSAKICVPPSSNADDTTFSKSTFRARLGATVEACRVLSKCSLWVEVPMSRASLIEDCEDFGLEFHHAVGHVASLNLWLRDSVSKIPEYATHHVGVGAVVVNSRNEILCVRELRNNYRPWKVPGGLAELGEQLDEAVVREVMEETGVPCRFQTVLSFRHTHGLNLGRSDLFFVCRLQPIEGTDEDGTAIIPEPVPEESEIETTAWIPLEEYRAMISGDHGHPMMQHIMKLYDQPWEDHDIQKTVVSSIVPGRQPAPIYHPPIRSDNK